MAAVTSSLEFQICLLFFLFQADDPLTPVPLSIIDGLLAGGFSFTCIIRGEIFGDRFNIQQHTFCRG
ncbi:hypothetical protein [Methanosphaerula palustris]|uniref:Uncharacterized protein n=1 Tax=Methanosphaerula palustris (strain ATCC BAA-1556 / DSM 19958 / E1-9c) TaxID=521011 RepID=B8GIR2_METPE|nr:hypothetical protein [Methanosphaerula palustris]ACL16875.1 hypothetical protein Mpal_1562 [Methanosphaerula palustris E1-9c]